MGAVKIRKKISLRLHLIKIYQMGPLLAPSIWLDRTIKSADVGYFEAEIGLLNLAVSKLVKLCSIES
jgi:hypothetical protein